jgi:hypothetical protein
MPTVESGYTFGNERSTVIINEQKTGRKVRPTPSENYMTTEEQPGSWSTEKPMALHDVTLPLPWCILELEYI